MLSRSSLETQKLELLSAMSELKLQQAALERDNLDLRDRLGEERRRNKPPVLPRAALLVTSTPVGSQQTTQVYDVMKIMYPLQLFSLIFVKKIQI